MTAFLTAAFYKFVDLPDFQQLREPVLTCCEKQDIKGTILLASEGINGTVAGPEDGVRAMLASLRSDARLTDLQHKESWSTRAPFRRMKVRLKREIVTMGVPGISPTQMAGTYVKPDDWNALISDPDVVLVDTRNDYEVSIGTFAGAINPDIQSFSMLPQWVAQAAALNPPTGKKPKVAMFCTGGIRCEKSTALLRAQGFDEVYHLEGGILKYLEKVPPAQSLWQGQCFVFDERVSVGHGLIPGQHGLCRACRQPLTDPDLASTLFEAGVSCPKCHAISSEKQKDSARERQRQWTLAKARGDPPPIGVRLPMGVPQEESRPLPPKRQRQVDGGGDFNSIQPKKLLLSKWTAVAPVSKEKHFLVTKLVTAEFEGGQLEWVDLEAVHSKATRRMHWKDLRDSTKWLRGWV